jgi:metallo-beta-lactamase family protein
VRIFQEEVAVRAKVHTIGGFSAHADQKEILTWLGHFKNPGLQVYVIHGEESASLALAVAIQKNFPFTAQVPHWLETIPLAVPTERPAELTKETEELIALYALLETRLEGLHGLIGKLPALKK